jgi:hypothetical protein
MLMRATFLAVLVVAAGSCAGSAQPFDTEALISAGFVMRVADTPAKLAALRALPANKFIHRTDRNGAVYYVYADHGSCACAYVGSQSAIDYYRRMMSHAMTPEQLGAGSNPTTHPVEQNIVCGMQDDDFENQFNRDALDMDAAPGFVPGLRQ